MNAILRYVVTPGALLSAMGNWSYVVLTEWYDRGKVTVGSTPPMEFTTRKAATEYALQKVKEWPYRCDALFLHPDTGKYLVLQ